VELSAPQNPAGCRLDRSIGELLPVYGYTYH